MTKDTYLYHSSEFPTPPVDVKSISLVFDMQENKTKVSADTTFISNVDNLTELRLNAKNLQIILISQNRRAVYYTYENDILTIQLLHPVKKGVSFRITTETVCTPTNNILEGLYYDVTPKGLPKTMITQCQQWGFQRIAPCIDDMRAKCTWETTIIADNRYTNMISNGNISKPRTRYDARRDTITYTNPEKMPPYLFFLGVGTWDTFSRPFLYPNGKKITLELMAPQGSDKKNADKALDIMSDAILWTHLYTGAERYCNKEVRDTLYTLCRKREQLLLQNADIREISENISELTKDIVFGYQYPFDVYREIAMHNSDFGGMENTGNTTIIASKIMPDAEITDSSYEYMMGVKQHEFYHNLNGSGVTGDTPFSIWLNEAVTVMMEDDYLAFHLGKDYVRLWELILMYAPGVGTFSLDTGSIAMPIEPSGFNDPNDLITSVTYVKAPEFTRMIEAFLGKEPFSWALALYHKRYFGANASPSDFLRTMEDVGKIDFSFMADRWLHQTGYPIVTASAEYNQDEQTAKIIVHQSGFGTQNPWIFPFTGQLCREDGSIIYEFHKKIEGEYHEFTVPCSEPFAFTVWNPRHVSYIKMKEDISDDLLYLRMEKSSDNVTRFLSFMELFDREMIRLCEDESRIPALRLANAYTGFIRDEELMKNSGSVMLTLFEHCSDPRFTYSYTKLHNAKMRFLHEAAHNHPVTLKKIYEEYSQSIPSEPDFVHLGETFKRRAVKNAILTLLSALDTSDTQKMVYDAYKSAECATDRLNSLTLYLSSSASPMARMNLMIEEGERAKSNAVAFENYISACALSSSPDTVLYLRTIEKMPEFSPEKSGLSRAMYLRFAENRKLSLETEEGRKFLEESLIKMAPVNEYLTNGMLNVFSHMNEYDDWIKSALEGILVRLYATLSEEKSPSVVSKVKALISS